MTIPARLIRAGAEELCSHRNSLYPKADPPCISCILQAEDVLVAAFAAADEMYHKDEGEHSCFADNEGMRCCLEKIAQGKGPWDK